MRINTLMHVIKCVKHDVELYKNIIVCKPLEMNCN